MSFSNQTNFSTSPLVFFYRLFWGELVLGVLYLSLNVTRISSLGFTERYPFIETLLSDTLSLVIFISLELVMISLAFISWYTERYIITHQIVSFSRFGLRPHIVFSLEDVLSQDVRISALEHWLRTGSVHVELVNGTRKVLSHVANPDAFVQLLVENKSIIPSNTGLPASLATASAKTLLHSDENQYIEFKSSLTFDYRKKRANTELPKAVLKNIVAFLNSSGGILLLGVNDKGKIIGLQPDFDTLSNPTADAWENSLTMLINNHIGVEFYQYLSISFETIHKKMIAIIRVNPSPMPAYLNFQGKEEFYIRTGNSSQPLSVAKATKYIQTHFAQLDLTPKT